MQAGYCTYKELKDGSLSLSDLIRMHDMLDYQSYLEAESYDRAKAAAGDK